MTVRRTATVGCLTLLTLAGCVGQQSMSSSARMGETVMVAFGAESSAPQYRKEELYAQLTDSAMTTVEVKIRAFVNIYADPTSRIGSDKADVFDEAGLRAAVIDLVDPNTGAVPTTIVQPGAAQLALRKRSNSAAVASGIKVQILSGTGTPNPINEQIFGESYVEGLVARPQVRFRVAPVLASYNQPVGSIEFELRFPRSLLDGMPETSWPEAILTSANQHLRFSSRYFLRGTDHVIKVLMVNPDGVAKQDTIGVVQGYRGTSPYQGLRFAIAWGVSLRQTTYPVETFDPAVITAATRTFRVFDVAGADITSNFNLITE